MELWFSIEYRSISYKCPDKGSNESNDKELG
jgi:hypothetical protein